MLTLLRSFHQGMVRPALTTPNLQKIHNVNDIVGGLYTTDSYGALRHIYEHWLIYCSLKDGQPFGPGRCKSELARASGTGPDCGPTE